MGKNVIVTIRVLCYVIVFVKTQNRGLSLSCVRCAQAPERERQEMKFHGNIKNSILLCNCYT